MYCNEESGRPDNTCVKQYGFYRVIEGTDENIERIFMMPRPTCFVKRDV